MTEERPKKVTIDPTYSSNPVVLRNFTKFVNELKKIGMNEGILGSLTEAKLASLVLSFQTTMEQLCGRDSSKPRPITKIPLSCLQDYSENGFLSALILLLCKEATESSTSLVDLFSDSKRSFKLLQTIEKDLTKVIYIFFFMYFLTIYLTFIFDCHFISARTFKATKSIP